MQKNIYSFPLVHYFSVHWTFFFIFSILLLFLNSPGAFSADASFAWDPIEEPELSGYKIYYGTSSRDYQFSVDVDNQTTYTISGLAEDTTYYFTATAYDIYGYETGFSDEVQVSFSNNSSNNGSPSSGGGSGGGSSSPEPECNFNTDCGKGYVCNTTNGSCVECLEDTQCDDGLACNGIEICYHHSCLPGESPCNSDEICDEEQDACVGSWCENDADCDDGVFCNGEEWCFDGVCAVGEHPCDEDLVCYEKLQICQGNDYVPDSDNDQDDDEDSHENGEDNPNRNPDQNDNTNEDGIKTAVCLIKDLPRPIIRDKRCQWLILAPDEFFYFNDASHTIEIENMEDNFQGVKVDTHKEPLHHNNFIFIPLCIWKDATVGQYKIIVRSYPVNEALKAYFNVK